MRKCWFDHVRLSSVIMMMFVIAELLVSPMAKAEEQQPGKQNRFLHDDLLDVQFVTEDEGWACGRWGCLVHTEDGGNSWTRIDPGLDYTLSAIYFVDEQNGWAVGDEGVIIHSSDGGKTWQKQEGAIIKPEFDEDQFAALCAENLFIKRVKAQQVTLEARSKTFTEQWDVMNRLLAEFNLPLKPSPDKQQSETPHEPIKVRVAWAKEKLGEQTQTLAASLADFRKLASDLVNQADTSEIKEAVTALMGKAEAIESRLETLNNRIEGIKEPIPADDPILSQLGAFIEALAECEQVLGDECDAEAVEEQVRKICEAVKPMAEGIPVSAPENTIDWINELLCVPNLYNYGGKGGRQYSERITARVRLMNADTIGGRNFSELSMAEQNQVKTVNRLLLEETFPEIVPKSSPSTYYHMDIFFLNPLKGWIVTEQTTILHTEDGGRTWDIQFSDQDFILKAISFADERNGWTAGEYGYIYHTSNGGITWEQQAGFFTISDEDGSIQAGTFLFDVYAVDAQTAWAVGIDSYITVTEDSGATWRTVPVTTRRTHLFSVYAPDADTVIAAGSGVLVYSLDKGASWKNAACMPPVDYTWLYAIARRTATDFIAVGREGTIYRGTLDNWRETVY